MVICLERGADLHMAQLMPLPLTVSFLSKIQTGFTFLVPAHPGSPGQKAFKMHGCLCVSIQEAGGCIPACWHCCQRYGCRDDDGRQTLCLCRCCQQYAALHVDHHADRQTDRHATQP